MRPQIQLDSEDIMLQLQNYLIQYAGVLNGTQCKKIADMLQLLYRKSKGL